MKLETIEIKNYRSLFADADGNHMKLGVGDRLNTIVGPNNCGKSNVFRALAIALDPDAAFDRQTDMPEPLVWSKPTITLTFRAGSTSRERTLLRRLEDYEREANPAARHTLAEDGKVRMRVTIESDAGEATGTRRQVFVASGAGGRSLAADHPLNVSAVEQFQKCFHFVLIRSGQGLDDLLEGKFRDILHNVLRDDLVEAFDEALRHRGEYLDQLRRGLLQPLSQTLGTELGDLFPEVESIQLEPDVDELAESLARMRVRVTDLVTTDIEQKGTGVRGGLLIAILRHFAETSRRSMLFAVEEPETFLHPAAQEDLRDHLEQLVERDDVTLLVATHSPYVVSRQSGSRVYGLEKDGEGRTVLVASATGGEPQGPVLGGLFRDRLVTDVLDRAASIPAEARGAVVVEGYTDEQYFRLAAERAGRPELIEDLAFVQAGSGVARSGAGGAHLAAMQALVVSATAGIPVVVVLDSDGPGKDAARFLRQVGEKTGQWNKRTVLEYGKIFGGHSFPYEAEDLWPSGLMERFLDQYGGRELPGRMHKGIAERPDDAVHYDLRPEAKSIFVDFLADQAAESDTERWVEMLGLLRRGLNLPIPEPKDSTQASGLQEPAPEDPSGTHSRDSQGRWLSLAVLPGEPDGWKESLDRLVAFTRDEEPSAARGREWMDRNLPAGADEGGHQEAWRLTIQLGIVTESDGRYTLTSEGRVYGGSFDPDWLARALEANIAGVRELRSLLSEGPAGAQQLLEVLQEGGAEWATALWRVIRRLRWLEQAGAAELVEDRWQLKPNAGYVSA